MKTHPISLFRRSVIYVAISTMMHPASLWATPLTLSTAPAGSSSKAPAPNVIVSVDDSGSMQDAGMAALRAALQQTFSESNVPDGSIRLAWQAMTNCFSIPSAACNNKNVMKSLGPGHRQNFMSWVNTLVRQSGTPSHRMFRAAGEYLRNPVDVNSAWASDPGTALNPVLSCRRSYNLFMTDGGWNKNEPADNVIGDVDNAAQTLPDGTVYDIVSDDTRIFRSAASGNINSNGHVAPGQPLFSTTLSDLAFYYWATDLQPGISNAVKPLIKSSGSTNVAVGATSKVIPEYWNPRNDPATWQHMTTYTVGFNGAANWTVNPKFGPSTWTDHPVTRDYSKLLLGLTTWPNPITGSESNERITELWHMALNSRGKYIPAPNAQSLATAFQDILNEIIADNSKPTTSVKGSASSLRSNSVLYAAGYDALKWTGQIGAYEVTANTGAVSSAGFWGTIPATSTSPAKPKTTATIMDETTFSPANRVVLTSQLGLGIPFEWTALLPPKQNELNTAGGIVDARGQHRLEYIRGDRTREAAQPPIANQPPNIFRDRDSRQGDVVNSELWYAPGKPIAPYHFNGYSAFRSSLANPTSPRPSMLYVGGNDGMLHGFDASTGQEKIAYIPDGLTEKLSKLTQPTYSHTYFVDGSPFVGDIYTGAAWKTYLAGFPGLGGKGYFVLDVTDPTAFSAANAYNTVVLDTTATTDPDIGRIVSQPVLDQTDPRQSLQLTRMNNNRWALVTGNGINSTSEKAVLLIQYVDGAKELVKITADNTGGNGNGLSAPRLIDLNGDYIPDVAYAGDLLGNLWKFDLTDPSASNWKVAFSGTPLYVAKDALNVRQPITTTPGWLIHPNGGLMIAFGTGRNLTDADRTSNRVHTLYGIYDSTSISAGTSVTLGTADNSVADRSFLVEQTISAAPTATTVIGSNLWTVSSNPIIYKGPGAKKGWFIDLPVARESATRSMTWFRGRTFGIPTSVPDVGGDPNVETCEPTSEVGKHYVTFLDIISGSYPKYAIYAYGVPPTNGNTVPSRVDDRSKSNSIYLDMPNGGGGGEQKCVTVPGAPSCDDTLGVPQLVLRPTWRQAQ